VDAGFGNERTACCKPGFTAGQGMFVKGRLVLVPIERLQPLEAEGFAATGRVPDTCFLHVPAVLVMGAIPSPETDQEDFSGCEGCEPSRMTERQQDYQRCYVIV